MLSAGRCVEQLHSDRAPDCSSSLHTGSSSLLLQTRTSVAERPGEGRRAAAAGEAAGSLHAAALVLAQGAVAAAVARTPGPNPGRDPGSLLQVQGGAVQLQSAETPPEALLPGRCPP